MSRRRRRGNILGSGGVGLVVDGRLSEDVTFTRASSATYFDSDGIIRTASTNEPRISYVQDGTGYSGLLIEPESSNLLSRSQELATSPWTSVGGAAVSLLSGTSIGLPRYSITGDNDDFDRIQQNISVSSGSTYSVTVFYEDTGTSGNFLLNLRDATGATESRVSGSIGSLSVSQINAGTVTLISETEISTNVYQLKVSWTPNFTGTSSIGLGPFTTGTETVVVLAVQFEEVDEPTSYIPTTTASATRAQDLCTIDLSSVSWFNNAEGSVFIDFKKLSFATLSSNAFFFSNGESNDNGIRLFLGNTNLSFGTVINSTVNTADISVPVNSLGRISGAIGYKENNFSYSANSSVIQTDTSTAIPTVDTLNIGKAGTNITFLNGIISSLVYYPQRLSDATLQYFANKQPDNFPSTIENLIGNYDASDDGTIISSLGKVGTWIDKSGASNNLTQTSASLQPSTGVDNLNGINVLSFDNSSLIGSSGIPQMTNKDSTLVVLVKNNDEDGGGGIVEFEESDQLTVASLRYRTAVDSILFSPSGGPNIILNAGDSDAFQVIFCLFDPATPEVIIDNQFSNTGSINSTREEADFCAIGNRSVTATASPLDGQIAQILVYEKLLSSDEIDSLMSYFQSKWKI